MEEKKKIIAELEKKSAEEGFWEDSQRAGKTMQDLEALKNEVEEFESLEKKIFELEEISAIAESKKDWEDIEKQIVKLEKDFSEIDFKTLFGGEYDINDCILSIHSGAGGADAQDWSEMLLRMYLKFCEKNGFKARILEESKGQEAGLKSATLEVSGPYAFGKLKSEAGVHRLVRLSPFNSDNLRQTSFSLVEVLPVIPEMQEVEILDKDLRIDVFRSGGAGGQSVNTTDSAVRITHLPTGIQATCQNERSQLQNKEQAMKILKAKLHKKHLEEIEKEKNELRGEQISAEWGSQIRSYVLHPYKQVKDHRTKAQSSDPEAVLDGKLEEFMEAFLRSRENIL